MTGFRGYVSSRSLLGQRAPQRVQNLVIRDYCERNELMYLLSAVEYVMDDCYAMLEKLLMELPNIEGLVFYSLFQLPPEPEKRILIYDRVMQEGCSLHFSIESLMVNEADHISDIEDIWEIQSVMPYAVSIDELASNAD